jgi:geranylgeranyl transferase type-2 subunit beta
MRIREPGWLELMDGLLALALQRLSEGFQREQAAYVRCRQQPDGGFPGRRGGSDPYYTEFAVRLLVALDPDPAALRLTAGYLAHVAPPPRDAVQVFSLLHAARLLAGAGCPVVRDPSPWREVLEAQRLPTGGLGRVGGGHVSVTQTFVGALGWELLGEPMPRREAAEAALCPLQGTGGGFGEQPGETREQTSATAGAVCFLMPAQALPAAEARRAGDFLLAQQTPAGGFRAHPDAPADDLLSTHNALIALSLLDRLGEADLSGVARHLRATARPEGGFAACAEDPETDLEYTYYGAATLALLRAMQE